VDTNVLVYAVDESEPVKREIARRTLASGDYGELVLSSQVLSEFYVTVTRKLARFGPVLVENPFQAR
jgi:predicted nucleic acid-binding protein